MNNPFNADAEYFADVGAHSDNTLRAESSHPVFERIIEFQIS